MNKTEIINLILAIGALFVTFISYYLYIRGKAYQEAEKAIGDVEQEDKTGKEKLAEAVEQVYALIPTTMKLFITKDVVKNIVQSAFDKIEAYAEKQVDKKGK